MQMEASRVQIGISRLSLCIMSVLVSGLAPDIALALPYASHLFQQAGGICAAPSDARKRASDVWHVRIRTSDLRNISPVHSHD